MFECAVVKKILSEHNRSRKITPFSLYKQTHHSFSSRIKALNAHGPWDKIAKSDWLTESMGKNYEKEKKIPLRVWENHSFHTLYITSTNSHAESCLKMRPVFHFFRQPEPLYNLIIHLLWHIFSTLLGIIPSIYANDVTVDSWDICRFTYCRRGLEISAQSRIIHVLEQYKYDSAMSKTNLSNTRERFQLLLSQSTEAKMEAKGYCFVNKWMRPQEKKPLPRWQIVLPLHALIKHVLSHLLRGRLYVVFLSACLPYHGSVPLLHSSLGIQDVSFNFDCRVAYLVNALARFLCR